MSVCVCVCGGGGGGGGSRNILGIKIFTKTHLLSYGCSVCKPVVVYKPGTHYAPSRQQHPPHRH